MELIKKKYNDFVLEGPNIKDWKLGAIGDDDIFEKPNWLSYDISKQLQKNRNFDTWSCTVFSTLKSLQYYFKAKYGLDFDFSENFTAVMSGVKYGTGNSYRNVLESIRKDGWLLEIEWPFLPMETKEEYFKPIPSSLKEKAKKHLLKWKVKWEDIGYWNVNHDEIKRYLKKSPVLLSGYAWKKNSRGIYFESGEKANHAFLCVDFEGYYPIIDDSYIDGFEYKENPSNKEFIKKLDKNFRFWSAHRLIVEPLFEESLINKFINMLKKIVRDVHGGFWFIKDNKKQKIDTPIAILASIADEFGVRTLNDEDLTKTPDYNWFK